MSNIIPFPKGFKVHNENDELINELRQRCLIYYDMILLDMKKFQENWEGCDYTKAAFSLERAITGYQAAVEEIKHMVYLQNS
jgi:hypothetical protein